MAKVMTQATRLALLERENTRLKMLCGRLAEWLGLPVGTLESSTELPTMTLLIEFPNGVVHFPLDKRYAQGIWHQFNGYDDEPMSDMVELRLNQLISGTLVRTLRTYFVTKEDEEHASTNG